MASYTESPAAARRLALRSLLARLGGYGALNVGLILDHVDRFGDATGCQYVRNRDRQVVGQVVGWHNAMNAVNEPVATAADWPAETEAYRWELGPAPTEAAAAAGEAVAG